MLAEKLRNIITRLYPGHFLPFLDGLKKLLAKHCNAIFSSLMIKSGGSIMPAHGGYFNLTVGNLYGQDLIQIWNSESFSSFRQNLMNAGGLFKGCSRCYSTF